MREAVSKLNKIYVPDLGYLLTSVPDMGCLIKIFTVDFYLQGKLTFA
jgi:hypothetical protein